MKGWGEKCLFGVALLSVASCVTLGAYTAYEDQWRLTTFRPTSAVVEDMRINPTTRAGKERFAPVVRYRFEVHGRSYVGTKISAWNSTFQRMDDAQEAIRPYMRGQQIIAFYDPVHPEDAVLRLERSTAPYWMLICGLLPILLLLFPSILLRRGVRPISAKAVRGRRRRYRFPAWWHPSTPPPFAFTMLRRGLGPPLQLLGLGLSAVGMLAVYVTSDVEPGPFLQLLFILLFAGLAWAGYHLRLLGVRAASPEAEQLLAQDPRPPVLYLRSFEDDESAQDDSEQLPHIFRPLFGRRDEDCLMRTISQFGPVIAVGRPGEWLPPAGAARLSVTAPDWRAEVERLCMHARIVVLRVGFTDGFWWEVRHVWERVPRDRILLWVPRTKPLDILERNREFKERFQAACGVDLPFGGLRRFIYFTSNGVPISLPVPSSGLRDVFNMNIDRDIARELEPFARSLGISLRIPTPVSAVRIIVLLIMAPAVVVIGCMTLWFALTTLGHVANLWRR